MGSRQVIMALMYWDTPVLQWNVQFVAINFLFKNTRFLVLFKKEKNIFANQ
jgi:hypothetical protein